MAVLDTNVLIRQVTQDDAAQATRAMAFLERLKRGEASAQLPEGVLVEVVQVLSSKNLYAMPREQIQEWLSAVIGFPGVELVNKHIYQSALDLYVRYRRLSFVDCLCVAHAQRFDDETVISFDRGFRNIEGLTWLEP